MVRNVVPHALKNIFWGAAHLKREFEERLRTGRPKRSSYCHNNKTHKNTQKAFHSPKRERKNFWPLTFFSHFFSLEQPSPPRPNPPPPAIKKSLLNFPKSKNKKGPYKRERGGRGGEFCSRLFIAVCRKGGGKEEEEEERAVCTKF